MLHDSGQIKSRFRGTICGRRIRLVEILGLNLDIMLVDLGIICRILMVIYG